MTQLSLVPFEMAMTELESQTLATTLYVSLFARAPDKGGLTYWTEKLQGGLSFQSMIGYFLSSDEGTALYGTNTSASVFIDNLYKNALNRTTDAGGSTFWQERLIELGDRNEMVEQFIKAVQGSAGKDQQLLSNRVDFGLSFAASKSGESSLYAKILLANVSSDPASLSLAKLVNQYVDNPPPPTPAAPSLALLLDTGVLGSDGITNNGTINVTLPTGIQSWSYSTDGGQHWNAGSGASFVLVEGTYLAGQIKARYVDAGGTQSSLASTSSDWVIDQTGPELISFQASIVTPRNVAGLSLEFNEYAYVGNTSNIAFSLDNDPTITVGFRNNGVSAGKLEMEADVGLPGRPVHIVLPAGMVLDAAGNPSQEVFYSDGFTFTAQA